MKFQKTTEYAIRILTLMASDPHSAYSAMTLHKCLELPYRYTAKLLTLLAKEGLIVVERGRNGGYLLAKNPAKISLKDIFYAVESEEEFNQCVMGTNHCSSNQPCCLHEKWKKPKQEIINMMEDVSLNELSKSYPN